LRPQDSRPGQSATPRLPPNATADSLPLPPPIPIPAMTRLLLPALALGLLAPTALRAQHDHHAMTASADQNPLLQEWTGPYGGVPAFDRMDLDHLEPALEAGMAAHLAEI